MHGFVQFPLARLCVLFSAHICVLMRCLLRVLQPEAGTRTLCLGNWEGRQRSHTKPEVGTRTQVLRHLGNPTKEPETGTRTLSLGNWEGRQGTHTHLIREDAPRQAVFRQEDMRQH